MNSKEKEIHKVCMKIYSELYAASTPPADFELLMEESPRNDKGQIMIPYWDYEIEQSVCDDIIKNILSNSKLKKYEKDGISRSIYLGCSPKFKKID